MIDEATNRLHERISLLEADAAHYLSLARAFEACAASLRAALPEVSGARPETPSETTSDTTATVDWDGGDTQVAGGPRPTSVERAVKVLEKNGGGPMRAGDIMEELARDGHGPVKRSSFTAAMWRESKRKDASTRRVVAAEGNATYKLPGSATTEDGKSAE